MKKKNQYKEVYPLLQVNIYACLLITQSTTQIVIDEIRKRKDLGYSNSCFIKYLIPFKKWVYSATRNASHNMSFNETS